MTKFRLLLRDLRQSRELSQEELARALQTSRQSIISLERGEYFPSFPLLIGLMEFFECPIEELVEGLHIQRQMVEEKLTQQGGGEEQMTLVPGNPFNAIDRMQEEMSDVVERSFGRIDWPRTLGTVAGAMNIHETDKEYMIEVQVPGYAEADLNIEMTEDTLSISGSHQEDQNAEKKNTVRREWQKSEFSRSIRFATPIKEDKVEAKLENGTLLITAPKVEPVKPKTTKIQVKKK